MLYLFVRFVLLYDKYLIAFNLLRFQKLLTHLTVVLIVRDLFASNTSYK